MVYGRGNETPHCMRVDLIIVRALYVWGVHLMVEKIVLVLLGVLLSGVGYIVKRVLEKKPTREKLDVQAKLFSINKQMKEQGLTPDDLTKLELVLTGRARSVEKHTQELEEAVLPLLEKSQGEFLSQADLNQRASDNLEIAKLKMTHVLNELKALLDAPERDALLDAQAAWESFCLAQAEASAIAYRGGSIYPLIYLSELDKLTVDRTARLQAELDELRRLGN